jgi:hypothetical protein
MLVIRKEEKRELDSVVEALIFSMAIYTLFALTNQPNPIALNEQDGKFSVDYNSIAFLVLTTFSLILPFVLAFVANNDFIMSIARKLKITKKTSRISVWHDAFYLKTPRVIINFVDGRRLFGWAEHYSDDPDKPFLYISQPQWINNNNKYIDLGLEGMLITPEQKINFIEFLKDEKIEMTKKRSIK